MSPAALKDLYERKASALERRPSFARLSGQGSGRVDSGLVCQVAHGDDVMWVDLPSAEGGQGSGPDPDVLMRASLIAGLAIGYKVWAARMGVPLASVTVDVTCELDARGPMGIAEVPVGWQRLSVDVTITSPAPEADVRRVVEQADRLNPMLANLSGSITRVHHLTVRPLAAL